VFFCLYISDTLFKYQDTAVFELRDVGVLNLSRLRETGSHLFDCFFLLRAVQCPARQCISTVLSLGEAGSVCCYVSVCVLQCFDLCILRFLLQIILPKRLYKLSVASSEFVTNPITWFIVVFLALSWGFTRIDSDLGRCYSVKR
jgi:hypothetical protein